MRRASIQEAPTIDRLHLACWGWFVLAMLSAWMVSPALFQLRDLLLAPEISLGFLVLVALAWWRINAALLLLGCQVYLLLVELPRSSTVEHTAWIPFWLLLLLIAVDRLRTYRQLVRVAADPAIGTQRRLPFWKRWQRLPQAARQATARFRSMRRSLKFSDELGAILLDWGRLSLMVLACGLLTWVLLWMIPLDELSRRKIRLLPTGYRAISITLVLGFVALAATSLVAGWSWRRISAAQARAFLRGSLASWLEPELRSIVRRRLRGRNRRASGKGRTHE